MSTESRTERVEKACGDCGACAEGGPAAYHPYAYCVLVKARGSVSADLNLAAVIEAARSEDPNLRRRVDEFLDRANRMRGRR